MVAYQELAALGRSRDSEARGRAAHLAVTAYLSHQGAAEERAALYAALVGFLDDSSVRVRGALAYGLLHAPDPPRPILLALLRDVPVIARALAQYSPALLDADMLSLVHGADEGMLLALAMRAELSPRLVEALVDAGGRALAVRLLSRSDAPFSAELLMHLAAGETGGDPQLSGALLARSDLPATARLLLVQASATALRSSRLVSGAIAPPRLARMLRTATDEALTSIGDVEAADERSPYPARLIEAGMLSTRVLFHAITHGHLLFFAACITELADLTRDKVATLLETGSRAAVNALLHRCGFSDAVRSALAALISHARVQDLAGDPAARHLVLTDLLDDLIAEHRGDIPPELDEIFACLSEQDIDLARRAVRNVPIVFAETGGKLGLQQPVLDLLEAA